MTTPGPKSLIQIRAELWNDLNGASQSNMVGNCTQHGKVEAEKIQQHLDSLVNKKDYAALAQYLAGPDLGTSYWTRLRGWTRLAKQAGILALERALLESEIHMNMSQTCTFFFRKQEVAQDALRTLNTAISLWMKFHANEAFANSMADSVKRVKQNGGTPAEVFRAFMDAYRERLGFQSWESFHVVGLLSRVYSVFEDYASNQVQPTLVGRSVTKRPRDAASMSGEGNAGEREGKRIKSGVSSLMDADGRQSDPTHRTVATTTQATCQDKSTSQVMDQESKGSERSDADAITPTTNGNRLQQLTSDLLSEFESTNNTNAKQDHNLPQNIVASFSSALKVEQEFQLSKANFQASEKGLQEASKCATESQRKFSYTIKYRLNDVYDVLDESTEYRKDKWDLDTAQTFLLSFQKDSTELENCLKILISQLLLEQEAKEKHKAARAEVKSSEEKKMILDKAMEALEALKHL